MINSKVHKLFWGERDGLDHDFVYTALLAVPERKLGKFSMSAGMHAIKSI